MVNIFLLVYFILRKNNSTISPVLIYLIYLFFLQTRSVLQSYCLNLCFFCHSEMLHVLFGVMVGFCMYGIKKKSQYCSLILSCALRELCFSFKCFNWCHRRVLKWFKNYLSDRSQLPGTSSGWVYIRAGVPQGSILGPLLFILFSNDIVTDIGFSKRLFADDTFFFSLS